MSLKLIPIADFYINSSSQSVCLSNLGSANGTGSVRECVEASKIVALNDNRNSSNESPLPLQTCSSIFLPWQATVIVLNQ